MSMRRLVGVTSVLCAIALSLLPAAAGARMMVARPPATSVATIQTELAALEPEVQRCATDTGTTRPTRVMINVYAFPQGQWAITFGPPRGTPSVSDRGRTAFETCVSSALAGRIGPRTERFTGTRPRKISRRFRLVSAIPTVVVTEPTVGPITGAHTAVVRRVLSSRRTQIQGCFPHASRASRTEIRVRLEVSPAGDLRVSGLRVPSHLDFPAVAQCVERALDGVRGPTSPATLRGEIPLQVQIDPAPAVDTPEPASTQPAPPSQSTETTPASPVSPSSASEPGPTAD